MSVVILLRLNFYNTSTGVSVGAQGVSSVTTTYVGSNGVGTVVSTTISVEGTFINI